MKTRKNGMAAIVVAVVVLCFASCVSKPAQAPQEAVPAAAVVPAPAEEAVAAPEPGEIGGPSEDGGILYESFEGEYAGDSWKGISDAWTGDPVWSATGCSIAEENATDGERSLMASFRFNGNSNKEVNSINRAPFVNMPSNLVDVSGVKAAKMDIFNDSKVTVHLSFVLATGDTWSWNRAARVDVKPGENKDLEWKLERDPLYGDADLSFKDLDKLKSCILDLFGAPEDTGKSGTLYIDNIRLYK
jgi:hypothetical protein